VKIDLDLPFLIILCAVAVLAADATPKARAKNPHSMGAAVVCRIGGPGFCPAPLAARPGQ